MSEPVPPAGPPESLQPPTGESPSGGPPTLEQPVVEEPVVEQPTAAPSAFSPSFTPGPPPGVVAATDAEVPAAPAAPAADHPLGSETPLAEPGGSGPAAADLVACPHCGAAVGRAENFCEACGSELTPSAIAQAPPRADPAPAPGDAAAAPGEGAPAPGGEAAGILTCACGGRFAADGYCELCGSPRPRERDHVVETPSSWAAGVCDRGVRHPRNEDAMAIAATAAPPASGGRAVLVVCDGVSSAPHSDAASLAAARAAREVLAERLQDGALPATGIEELAPLLRRAVEVANAAVVATTVDAAVANPPSCTFVVGLVEPGLLVAASIGDSRAYWLPDDATQPDSTQPDSTQPDSSQPDSSQPVATQPIAAPSGDGARALTTDDSLAAEAVAAGVPAAQAETMRGAHTITRWLGVDGPDLTVRPVPMQPATPGWLLVCSDGLWNYCSPAPDLAALVHSAATQHAGDPTATAEALVAWAIEQGGADNISVALARIDLRPAPVQEGLASPTCDVGAAPSAPSSARESDSRGTH